LHKICIKFKFNEQSVTFEDVVDVVLEVVDAHGIVQVAFLVAVSVLGDDDGRIVVRVFQIIQQLAEAPRNDLEPRRGRSAPNKRQPSNWIFGQWKNLPEPSRILVALDVLVSVVADQVDVLHFVADVARRVVVEAEEIGASFQLLDLVGCEFRKTRLGETLSRTLPANLRKSIKSV
jgi:hypothetical protein